MSKLYIPKEISWLSFNERVLQEAENKEVPLLERFKYLGIYSNNLDEYISVMVAPLKWLSLYISKSYEILGYFPITSLYIFPAIFLALLVSFEMLSAVFL